MVSIWSAISFSYIFWVWANDCNVCALVCLFFLFLFAMWFFFLLFVCLFVRLTRALWAAHTSQKPEKPQNVATRISPNRNNATKETIPKIACIPNAETLLDGFASHSIHSASQLALAKQKDKPNTINDNISAKNLIKHFHVYSNKWNPTH